MASRDLITAAWVQADRQAIDAERALTVEDGEADAMVYALLAVRSELRALTMQIDRGIWTKVDRP